MFHLVVAILGREVGIVVTLEKLNKQCSLGKLVFLHLGWYLAQMEGWKSGISVKK